MWRYQPIDSYVPTEQKERVMMATLRKVEAMASDQRRLVRSALAKLKEFAGLGYPPGMRAAVCYRVAAAEPNPDPNPGTGCTGDLWKGIALMQRILG